jgi:predicted nucleic acid-binding protein
VECLAAVAQGERAEEYGSAQAHQALARLASLREEWNEILPSEEIRDWAAALLTRHPLRAADALQLGAAVAWSRGRPRDHRLLTLDSRLSDAARGEGFTLVI